MDPTAPFGTDRHQPTRRQLLVAAGAGTVGALAGCLGGDDGEVPAASSIEADDSCEQCGMVLTEHPGPVGQAFYDDHPDLEDDRATFCSGTCTYGWTLDEAEDGHDPLVTYLTDYSSADWETLDEGGEGFISAHFNAEDQADVTALSLVAGSDLRGSMGQEIIGFSEQADAQTFQDTYGGELLEHDDVTRELVDSLGGM
ncbi:nitrous oxide reductase accessory protein NosL [Halobacteria archaeon AArc-curdl1]|uniref:Nitrous oxide reductase accessory protein NosL n=1 Tax=Natronosalvus hydrolyticus TaxID=2979988 RepID=A0AAP2ZAK7_9EURY|nr:nitrous oxide reductase accessory protein NosL [Halobacteria archaeon AArc-curdl1]